ncbi:MAG: response regulator [Nitrospiraceae bacterium]|nr:response regulator [Nitrospiraceae bacterium]
MVICEYLRDCGFRVIEAATGEEAVIVLQQPDLAINVVFSDVQLGSGIDGFAVSQWVRANRPELDIMLVGNIERAADVAAELCENGPTLSKPYEPQTVVDRIRRLLAERKPHGS